MKDGDGVDKSRKQDRMVGWASEYFYVLNLKVELFGYEKFTC